MRYAKRGIRNSHSTHSLLRHGKLFHDKPFWGRKTIPETIRWSKQKGGKGRKTSQKSKESATKEKTTNETYPLQLSAILPKVEKSIIIIIHRILIGGRDTFKQPAKRMLLPPSTTLTLFKIRPLDECTFIVFRVLAGKRGVRVHFIILGQTPLVCLTHQTDNISLYSPVSSNDDDDSGDDGEWIFVQVLQFAHVGQYRNFSNATLSLQNSIFVFSLTASLLRPPPSSPKQVSNHLHIANIRSRSAIAKGFALRSILGPSIKAQSGAYEF